jgi:hypothetical protein
MKSASSFQDKPNSIISEEDSAFCEQTPGAKEHDNEKGMTFNEKIE